MEKSPEAERLLETATSILEESFKYRRAHALEHPKYNLLSWDAGWAQLYRLCYSRDALPAAKANKTLIELRKTFESARKELGDKIAKRYSEDTGF